MKFFSLLFLLFVGAEDVGASSIEADQDNYITSGVMRDGTAGYLEVRGVASLSYARKSYIHFDLSGVSYSSEASATFSVTCLASPAYAGKLFVRGLNDGFTPGAGVLGTDWVETSLNWTNAPGNNVTHFYGFESASTTAVGDQQMTAGSVTNGLVLEFTINRLGDFVQSDGTLTLMMSSYDGASGNICTIASSENGTYSGPTLFFDNTSPSKPNNLAVYDVSETSSRITWDVSTDDGAIENYKVYRDEVCIVTTNTTEIYDTGLSKYSSYEYTVEAYDTSGNVSPVSDVAQYGYCRFPFLIKPIASQNGITDMSGLSTNPANAYVTASGGDLVANGSPIRFLGVNLSTFACFPTHDVAETFALHLKKMGVNCVRLSACDRVEPYGIFKDLPLSDPGYMKELDPVQLERMDYLIYQLKSHGIYVDLILHMVRNYPGMPTEGTLNYFKGTDIYYPEMITLQKDFARDLLSHTNAYTSVPYKDEPAVAFIEINNENGLIHKWFRGLFGPSLHQDYVAELEDQWHAWLSATYTNTATLQDAWLPTGGYEYDAEELVNGSFSSGISSWTVQASSPAAASYSVKASEAPDGSNALEINVSNAGTSGWHVQCYQTGVHLVEGVPYTVSFWAKAEAERDLTVKLQASTTPYATYGDAADFKVGTEWEEYIVVIIPSQSDPNARISITNLGLDTGKVWFANASVRMGNTMISSAAAEIEQLSTNEIISNGSFSSGTGPWSVYISSPAVGTYGVDPSAGPNGENALKVSVTTADTTDPWRARFYQLVSSVTANQPYILSFWAKSDSVRTIRAGLYSDSSPWNITETKSVVLGTEWKKFNVVVCPDVTESSVRVHFTDLAAETGDVWFTGISLTTGIKGLKSGETLWGMGIFDLDEFDTRTKAAQKDWMRFLWETEKNYYTGMKDYVKNTLGAHGLIIGSQLYFSPALIQSEMDVVDSHFYAGHPQNTADPDNWYFTNYSSAGHNAFNFTGRNAPLSSADKPLVCTEFNHPNPSTYGGEAFLLAAAYASLQKWDAVFAFNLTSYANTAPSGYFHHFYSIISEPAKLVGFPAAATMLRRGDIERPASMWGVTLSVEDVIGKYLETGTDGIGADDFGFSNLHSLQRPIGLRSGEQTQFVNSLDSFPTVLTSDTGEHVWDSVNKLVYIKAVKSKALIGRAGQQAHDLGDGVSVTTTSTMQPGDWTAISLIVKDGSSFVAPGAKLLITATGYTDNTHMVWKSGMGPEAYVTDGNPSSVGANWGKASVLLEGITASITLSGVSATDVQVWSLDEDGARVSSVIVTDNGAGNAVFVIDKSFKTPWYEVEIAN